MQLKGIIVNEYDVKNNIFLMASFAYPGCTCSSFGTILFIIIWFVRLLALRPLLAFCASLG
jgi:hypothetical protein